MSQLANTRSFSIAAEQNSVVNFLLIGYNYCDAKHSIYVARLEVLSFLDPWTSTSKVHISCHSNLYNEKVANIRSIRSWKYRD